jgi:hypothetical protein
MTDNRKAVPQSATHGAPMDAWAGITDAEAERIAGEAVQALADSDPDDDAIEAMERLKGTPQEHMFCVDAATLSRVIATEIQNAAYDARHFGSTPTLLPPHNLELLERLFDFLSGRSKSSMFSSADMNTLGGILEYVRARTAPTGCEDGK